MKNSYNDKKTILPVSWNIDYSKSLAIVNVRNVETGYDNTVLVDYRLFSFDSDLAEATLNIALMDEVQTSFEDDDAYLDWLAYSVEKGLISEPAY